MRYTTRYHEIIFIIYSLYERFEAFRVTRVGVSYEPKNRIRTGGRRRFHDSSKRPPAVWSRVRFRSFDRPRTKQQRNNRKILIARRLGLFSSEAIARRIRARIPGGPLLPCHWKPWWRCGRHRARNRRRVAFGLRKSASFILPAQPQRFQVFVRTSPLLSHSHSHIAPSPTTRSGNMHLF